MTKATLLAATAAIALIATPALARDTAQPQPKAHHSQVHHVKSHKVHRSMHHARTMRSNDRLARHDQLNSNWTHRSGFWPAETAAGIAGGAISTAGMIASDAVGAADAIATAPFRGQYGYYGRYERPYGDVAYRSHYGSSYPYGDTYAFADEDFGTYSYNGVAIPGSSSYDARNGFTCRPGTVTKLPNGEHTICQ